MYLLWVDVMKKESRWIMIVLAIILIIAGSVVFVLVLGEKDYTGFATCLADKGYVLAGTDWCPHCKTQKAIFKGAFEEVIIPMGAYKDCDHDQQWCQDHDVKGYPTWILPDGNTLVGVQKIDALSRISGCST